MPPVTPPSRSRPFGGEGEPVREQSVADFFGDALEGAVGLVHADGGDIATLDEARQVMVLRARRRRSRVDATAGLLGGVSRGQATLPGNSSSRSKSHLAGLQPGLEVSGLPGQDAATALDELGEVDEIDAASTQLLPTSFTTRVYHKGERLIGHCWQRGEPVVMGNDECRNLPGGNVPADHEAPWHLAVPIFRPRSLASLHSGSDIIGVISVYIRDPLWSFSPRDVELLQLHAERVALAMRSAELARQNQSQTELLNLLDLEEESRSGSHVVFARLLGVVRRMIEAPAFAILLYDRSQGLVSFELAERDEEPIPLVRLPTKRMPPWWGPVSAGQTICVSAPEERALHPEYCHLGWEEDPPILSILATPLLYQNELVGAIVAGSPRSDVYAPEHAQLFSAIGRSAAVVVQNALLMDKNAEFIARTRRKEEQLAALNNAALTLNESLNDIDATVQAIATQAAALTEAVMCVVLLKDETGKYLEGHADSRHLPEPFASEGTLRIPLQWHGIGSWLSEGQFDLLKDLDSEWSDTTDIGQTLAEWKIQSCLIVPIIHEAEQLGILVAYTPGMLHHFRSEEIGLLQGVASQAAVAIHNAKMHRQLQDTLDQLRDAYEKQKELDKYKDEFILMVSHEFRTPLTAIEGYVTLINRHGDKLDQSKLDQFAGEIRQATDQLMGMIGMLQDANRTDEKPLELTLDPVDIGASARKAISSCSPEIRARLGLELAAEAEIWVMADGDRLSTVFTNLIGNATKYSSEGSPCQVKVRLAECGFRNLRLDDASPGWVVVGVSDQGSGIAPEEMSQLFTKFGRLRRSLTTSVRGTGLGLWICKQYIDAMGGDIWVDSEFGKGSNFQFCLPLAQSPRER